MSKSYFVNKSKHTSKLSSDEVEALLRDSNPFYGPYSGYNYTFHPEDSRMVVNSGWSAGDANDANSAIIRYLNSQLAENALWNGLDDGQKKAVINSAYTDPTFEFLGNKQRELYLNDIVQDFNTAQKYLGEYESDLKPIDYEQVDRDLYNNYYQPIFDRIDQEQADARSLYDTQLKDSTEAYNRNANAILGNQYRQNAVIQDSLRSDLARTRQQALEAGASAGLRIAGNVNATLAAQNKAAQTSMETANNLSQLLLNQRQAAAGIRSDYQNYMTNSNRYRDQQQSNYLERRASERQLAKDDYDNRLSQAEDKLTVNLGEGNYARPYAEGALRKKIYQ